MDVDVDVEVAVWPCGDGDEAAERQRILVLGCMQSGLSVYRVFCDVYTRRKVNELWRRSSSPNLTHTDTALWRVIEKCPYTHMSL